MWALLPYNVHFFVFVIHIPLKSIAGLQYAAVSPDVAGNHRNTVSNDTGLMKTVSEWWPWSEVIWDSWALILPVYVAISEGERFLGIRICVHRISNRFLHLDIKVILLLYFHCTFTHFIARTDFLVKCTIAWFNCSP